MRSRFTFWLLVHILTTSVASAAEVFVFSGTHIRTLAASCAACHGTLGNSSNATPTLAGLEAGYFITQMQGFRNGSRPATVMHHHSKGLDPEEINQLAVYFSLQKRAENIEPKPQSLKANHAD
ncbi:MAG: c-type cytochrome [Methylotenera sp.]